MYLPSLKSKRIDSQLTPSAVSSPLQGSSDRLVTSEYRETTAVTRGGRRKKKTPVTPLPPQIKVLHHHHLYLDPDASIILPGLRELMFCRRSSRTLGGAASSPLSLSSCVHRPLGSGAKDKWLSVNTLHLLLMGARRLQKHFCKLLTWSDAVLSTVDVNQTANEAEIFKVHAFFSKYQALS